MDRFTLLVVALLVVVNVGENAIFAGGCFWCMEQAFEGIDGVSDVVSGYSGGTMVDPVYRDHGDHYETIEVSYDADVIPYSALVEYYWRNVDPLDGGGQFCDRGHSYEACIFYSTSSEQDVALASKDVLEKRHGWEIETKILPATKFWPAEGYHQDYYKKNPERYHWYKTGCGRVQRLKELWDNDGYEYYHNHTAPDDGLSAPLPSDWVNYIIVASVSFAVVLAVILFSCYRRKQKEKNHTRFIDTELVDTSTPDGDYVAPTAAPTARAEGQPIAA